MSPFELRGATLRPLRDVHLVTRGEPVVLHPSDIVVVENVSSDSDSGGFFVTFQGKIGSLPFSRMETDFESA
ncbi:MAG: hypothetical protein EXS46_00170 [Candidatus Taylorbacteria bacterium]|nr:hypothetical protein [Candidatus Taylorbacteria bacterium]